ncbi:MAG: guanylate kinase [Planctomycetes bacterium]|jgi:guanylate kinase|nr:guanylate kinase [Phycisphaerae bacterium]NBB94178.1 guanylate kinase [Planctomycetota bacterium]
MSNLRDGQAGKLVVVSGPSGVGKSTIDHRALAATGAEYSCSVTTRAPRPGEVDGRDYRFVDRTTFETMIADGELLEWAEVFGNYYGTPAGPVEQALRQGRRILLEIDVQGGVQVHERMPDATFVLIVPPSLDALRQRLTGRGTEHDATAQVRLEKAEAELDVARSSGVYTREIVNADLDEAVGELIAIIEE